LFAIVNTVPFDHALFHKILLDRTAVFKYISEWVNVHGSERAEILSRRAKDSGHHGERLPISGDGKDRPDEKF
jgi:hypothetical protein